VFASASLTGSLLEISPLQTGGTEYTVTAADSFNKSITSTLRILVYPAAFDLSEGDYFFTEWQDTHADFSYPPHMLFLQSDTTDPGVDYPLLYPYFIPHDDYHVNDAATTGFPYNNTSRTRINGLGSNGISFINTGRSRDLGGALLAVSTHGIEEVKLNWTAGTLSKNERLYGMRLQYRTSLTDDFRDIYADNNLQEYKAGKDGEEKNFRVVSLPADAQQQDYVQLLWRYFYLSGQSGARSQLRLDNIRMGRLQSDDAFITSFWFLEVVPVDVAIDHANMRIRVIISDTVDIKALTPVVSVSGAARLVLSRGEDGKPLPMDFSVPVELTVISESGFVNNRYSVVVEKVLRAAKRDIAISIYPNPAKDRVQVVSDMPLDEVVLISSLGKIIKQVVDTGRETSIDLSGMRGGFYFIRVRTGEEVRSFKIMKIEGN
jgi:hypothetical protein